MKMTPELLRVMLKIVWSFSLVHSSFIPANDSCLNPVYRNSVQIVCGPNRLLHCLPAEDYQDGWLCRDWKWIAPDLCACYKERLGGIFSCPCNSSYGLCPSDPYHSNEVIKYDGCFRSQFQTEAPVTTVDTTTVTQTTKADGTTVTKATEANGTTIPSITREKGFEHEYNNLRLQRTWQLSFMITVAILSACFSILITVLVMSCLKNRQNINASSAKEQIDLPSLEPLESEPLVHPAIKQTENRDDPCQSTLPLPSDRLLTSVESSDLGRFSEEEGQSSKTSRRDSSERTKGTRPIPEMEGHDQETQNYYVIMALMSDVAPKALKAHLEKTWQDEGCSSLSQFLELKKHVLFHMSHRSCCCKEMSTSLKHKIKMPAYQWNKLFSENPEKPHPYRNQPCHCKFEVRNDLSLENLDSSLCRILLGSSDVEVSPEQTAAISKLRDIRNCLVHSPNVKMSDDQFNSTWAEAVDNIGVLTRAVSNKTDQEVQKEIDDLKKGTFNESELSRYHGINDMIKDDLFEYFLKKDTFHMVQDYFRPVDV